MVNTVSIRGIEIMRRCVQELYTNDHEYFTTQIYSLVGGKENNFVKTRRLIKKILVECMYKRRFTSIVQLTYWFTKLV